MVPGPADDPAGPLAKMLAQCPLGSRLRRPPRTVVALPAAPRVHLAPAVPPMAGGGRLTVGTGALRCDPLTGTGTAQALRTAILAAVVVDAPAAGTSAEALCDHYTNRLRVVLLQHPRTCLEFYERAFTTIAWREEIDATQHVMRATTLPRAGRERVTA